MPWELDLALLSFIQLKKSKYYTSDKITIETVLNLSSYVINWDKSVIPKEFYIKKYESIAPLLCNYNYIPHVYDGVELYGHLDFQREVKSTETDIYMSITPDMYFDEETIPLLIEGAKNIKNKYFVITPQISKLWDSSWDVLVHDNYKDLQYENWHNVDIFDIWNNNVTYQGDITLQSIDRPKFAGWCDVYSKAFYEELVPIWDEWHGYGSWDYYSMLVAEWFQQHGGDFQQYILKGKTIFEYTTGPLINGFSYPYKDLLKLNDIVNQRETFKNKIPNYVNTRIIELNKKLKGNI